MRCLHLAGCATSALLVWVASAACQETARQTVVVSDALWETHILTTVRADRLDPRKRTKQRLYLTSVEVHRALATGRRLLFIDIRTQAEAMFVGFATVTLRNIPYMMLDFLHEYDPKAQSYRLTVNPDFAKAIATLIAERGLENSAAIALICRSGDYSARAADYLASLGYTKVYSVVDGFEGDLGPTGRRDVNGWKNSELPWSYQIAPSQAYPSPTF